MIKYVFYFLINPSVLIPRVISPYSVTALLYITKIILRELLLHRTIGRNCKCTHTLMLMFGIILVNDIKHIYGPWEIQHMYILYVCNIGITPSLPAP